MKQKKNFVLSLCVCVYIVYIEITNAIGHIIKIIINNNIDNGQKTLTNG